MPTIEELQHAYRNVGGWSPIGHGLSPADAARLRASIPQFAYGRPSPTAAGARTVADIEAALRGDSLDEEAERFVDRRNRHYLNAGITPNNAPVPSSEPPELPGFTRRFIGSHDVTEESPPGTRVSPHLVKSLTSKPGQQVSQPEPEPESPMHLRGLEGQGLGILREPSTPSTATASDQPPEPIYSDGGRNLSNMTRPGIARVLEHEARRDEARKQIYDAARDRRDARKARMLGIDPLARRMAEQRSDLAERGMKLREREAAGAPDELQAKRDIAEMQLKAQGQERFMKMGEQYMLRAMNARQLATQLRASPNAQTPAVQKQIQMYEQQAAVFDQLSRAAMSKAGVDTGTGIPVALSGDAGDAESDGVTQTMWSAWEKAKAAGATPEEQVRAYFDFLPEDLKNSTQARSFIGERLGSTTVDRAVDEMESEAFWGKSVPLDVRGWGGHEMGDSALVNLWRSLRGLGAETTKWLAPVGPGLMSSPLTAPFAPGAMMHRARQGVPPEEEIPEEQRLRNKINPLPPGAVIRPAS